MERYSAKNPKQRGQEKKETDCVYTRGVTTRLEKTNVRQAGWGIITQQGAPSKQKHKKINTRKNLAQFFQSKENILALNVGLQRGKSAELAEGTVVNRPIKKVEKRERKESRTPLHNFFAEKKRKGGKRTILRSKTGERRSKKRGGERRYETKREDIFTLAQSLSRNNIILIHPNVRHTRKIRIKPSVRTRCTRSRPRRRRTSRPTTTSARASRMSPMRRLPLTMHRQRRRHRVMSRMWM